MTNKKIYYTLLIAVLIFGFLYRLKVCHDLYVNDINVSSPSSLTDMATYLKLSSKVVAGSFTGHFKYQPFYYVVFLPLIILFFGKNIFIISIIQAIIGALTILFSALSAKIIFGNKTSIITAILVCLSQTLVFYTPFIMIVTLQAFWLSVLFYFLILGVSKKSIAFWAISGLILGCSILTRGNSWLFLPLFITVSIFISIKNNSGFKKIALAIAAKTVALIIPLMLIQSYFVIHNSIATGKFTGSSTDGANVICMGNSPDAAPTVNDPRLNSAGIVGFTPLQQYWLDNRHKVPISKRLIEVVSSQPLKYIEMTFRKLILFWVSTEIPNNVNINKEKYFSSVLRDLGISFGIIAVLCIAGILCMLIKRLDIKQTSLLMFIFTYWISISIFFILSRFRAPLIPILSIPAGFFVVSTVQNIRFKKLISLIQYTFFVIVGVFIVYFLYGIYSNHIESKVYRFISPNGNSYFMGNVKYITDNASPILGGWEPMKLNTGDLLQKKINVNSSIKDKDIILKIPIISSCKASISFTVHRKNFKYNFNASEIIWINLPVTVEASNSSSNQFTVDIRINNVKGNVFAQIDTHREYGRTYLNRVPVIGELVGTLTIKNNSKGQPNEEES